MVMRKLAVLAGVAGAVVLVNALIDSVRTCQCLDECWCRQAGLRHFRWWVPVGHSLPV
jgi:hypothetical protein